MIKNIILQTALSLYSQAGSSVTAALKTAALGALKNGSMIKPDRWRWDGLQIVYDGYDRTFTNYAGPLIEVTLGEGSIGAVYRSGIKTPWQMIYPYTMGYYDQLKITKLHLMAGSTAYATADIPDITFNSVESFVLTHTVWTQPYASGVYIEPAGRAIADALRTGSCNKITALQYTTTTGGSTFYTANNFGWNGYVAHGETAPLASGNPNLMRLVNTNDDVYAKIVPYTSQTPAAGSKYNFQFTIGTTP